MGVLPSMSDNYWDLIINRLETQTSIRTTGQSAREEGDKPITVEERSVYLRNLLIHDPGVFLERHGAELVTEELEYFQALRSSSYEVDVYLKLLEDKATTSSDAQQKQQAARAAPSSTPAKNRRLAKFQILESEGYFKIDAMRRREPYLYHLYIGQYSDQPFGSINEENDAAAEEEEKDEGEKTLAEASTAVRSAAHQLTENILNQHDELDLMLRTEAEREAYALQEEENESEEEEEEEDADEAGVEGGGAEVFLDIMKQKFLSGQDASINYTLIDADTSLDDHFADLERQNAEDAYFDASD